MDDDDADYMQGSDDEVSTSLSVYTRVSLCLAHLPQSQDYGFAYSDDDDGNEPESADVENMYYTAKCMSQ